MARDPAFPDLAPAPPPPSPAADRGWLAGFALLAFVLTGVLAALVLARAGGPLAPDAWAIAAAAAVRSDFITLACRALDDIGNYYMVVAYGLGVALYAWNRGERRIGAAALAVPGGLAVLLEALKRAVDRPRPVERLMEEFGQSFPSGHSAGMLGFCLVLIAILRRSPLSVPRRRAAEAALLAFALAMGASRVYLCVHYLSDVVAGALLAVGWFCACWWWVRKGEVTPWER